MQTNYGKSCQTELAREIFREACKQEQLYIQFKTSRGGEIGRRACLRSMSGNWWRFDSSPRHRMSKANEVSVVTRKHAVQVKNIILVYLLPQIKLKRAVIRLLARVKVFSSVLSRTVLRDIRRCPR